MTKMSEGLSMATMARAASCSFSQVLPRLRMLTPSARRLYTYCSIWKLTFSEPRWVVATNILVMSSSLRDRISKPPDMLTWKELRTSRCRWEF
uniref:GM15484p n=1 Tax=Drosophila melanogaster TaxID=7227 RepID=Q8MSF9_DROME|nr:GM15484p [Drosophila melanogaster]